MKIELSRIPFPQKDAKARTQFKIKPVLSSSRSGRKRQWIDKSTFVSAFRFKQPSFQVAFASPLPSFFGYRIPFLELIHRGLVQSSFMDDVFRYQKRNH